MDRLARHAPSYRSICAQCRRRLLPVRTTTIRPLSTSTPNGAKTPDPPSQPPTDNPTSEPAAPTQPNSEPTNHSSTSPAPARAPEGPPSMLNNIRQVQFFAQKQQQHQDAKPDVWSSAGATTPTVDSIYDHVKNNPTSPHVATAARLTTDYPVLPEPHHLHIYSTRHNTHITLTKPDRNAIISVSAGSIGFRKAARGTYDAAYQLGAYVMGRIQQLGLLTQIQQLEVVLRDFGPGREAVTKILLGSEGRNLRGRVVRVCDATRLKFGGTRSKNARRL
ncbi:MAG: hypothetical protein LQ344_004109 [Seirophora lacunosa]|nr:MAG: hypothetical protein LQ344_004109 [Seirophora lacunosa]